MREFISIGQIINTHGLKGELKVYPLTDDIRRFRKLTEIYINETLYKIVWCKLQTDKVILKLEGIDTIEAAQRLKNNYLEVKRENAVSLEEGEFFIADIIGCKVYDENMKELGAIFDVIQTPSNDVYWVKGKEEILIPALKNVVLSISVDKREVIIKPLEVWQQ